MKKAVHFRSRFFSPIDSAGVLLRGKGAAEFSALQLFWAGGKPST